MQAQPAKSIVTHASLERFFTEAVEQAISEQQLHARNETVRYVAALLSQFSRAERLLEQTPDGPQFAPLAHYYGVSQTAPTQGERLQALQRLGDIALFIAGLFQASLARKPIDVDYYAAMGGAAYGTLADRGHSQAVVYAELAEKFVDFAGRPCHRRRGRPYRHRPRRSAHLRGLAAHRQPALRETAAQGRHRTAPPQRRRANALAAPCHWPTCNRRSSTSTTSPGALDVRDHVFSDRAVFESLAPDEFSAGRPEALLIAEGDGELGLSLFIDASVVEQLDGAAHDRHWHVAAEGVSHFLYVAWSAGHGRSVSQLELELQADVDRYALCLLTDDADGNAARRSAALRERLFVDSELLDTLASDERERYAQASDLADGVTRWLETHCLRNRPHGTGGDALLRSLRRFYRLGSQRKIASARACMTDGQAPLPAP